MVPFSTSPAPPSCSFTALKSKPQGVTVEQLAGPLSVQTRRGHFRLRPVLTQLSGRTLCQLPMEKCPLLDKMASQGSRCVLPRPPLGPCSDGPVKHWGKGTFQPSVVSTAFLHGAIPNTAFSQKNGVPMFLILVNSY